MGYTNCKMINEYQLHEIINEQLENLEKKAEGVSREIDYDYFVQTPFITVITGIRRCGKSTVLHQKK